MSPASPSQPALKAKLLPHQGCFRAPPVQCPLDSPAKVRKRAMMARNSARYRQRKKTAKDQQKKREAGAFWEKRRQEAAVAEQLTRERDFYQQECRRQQEEFRRYEEEYNRHQAEFNRLKKMLEDAGISGGESSLTPPPSPPLEVQEAQGEVEPAPLDSAGMSWKDTVVN